MPRWTDEQLSEKLAEGKVSVSDKGLQGSSEPQQPVQYESLGEDEGEEINPTGFHIRITAIRKRPIDPDNLVVKWFTDCLRYAGVIGEDTAEEVQVEIIQKKGKKDATLIEVFEICSE